MITSIGLCLVIFTLSLVVLLGLIHKFYVFDKNSKYFKLVNSYWFWFSIGLFGLIYFIGFRWSFDLEKLININNNINVYGNVNQQISFLKSRVLLLDFCPFVYVATCLFLMFDKKRNYYKLIAQYGLIGGLLNLFFVFLSVDLEGMNFFEYFFIGSNKERLWFFSHFYLIIVSFLMLINIKTYSKWDFIASMIFIYGFLFTALIISKIWNITNNVSGLVNNDYFSDKFNTYKPPFAMIPIMLNNNNYVISVIFLHCMIFISSMIIVVIKNRLTFNKELKTNYFISKRWYDFKFFNYVKKPFIWIDYKWYQFELLFNKKELRAN